MKKYINKLLIIIFIILEIFLLSHSKLVINSFNKTFNICIYTLMPIMFFSLSFSQILINLNFENFIPNFIKKFLMKLLNINQNDVTIYILSILCGYPNNAKFLIDNNNLNNIIQYTNFVNPLYMICTVNTLYLKNIRLTLIILVSHYTSNIILGIILRNKNINNKDNIKINNESFIKTYSNTLKNTIYTLSIIFSNILFFSIIIALFTNILHFKNTIIDILLGLIEFSFGIYNICSTNINEFFKGLIILIIITFGSFSIHFQILSINNKIKYIKYLLYRLFNVFISIIIYLIIF